MSGVLDALAERAALAIATAEADHAALQRAIAHMAGEAGRTTAAVEAEREACAIAVERLADELDIAEHHRLHDAAALIRARGGR